MTAEPGARDGASQRTLASGGRRARISPERAALLVIDIQERLLPAMPEDVGRQIVKNARILIETATRFGLPIIASQQYPKGLGLIVLDLEAALAAATTAGAVVHRLDKIEFSIAASAGFADLRTGALAGRDQWLVAGMEAHICVYQSVRDLAPTGNVYVVADAVCSRTKANWRAGLDLADRLGAIITTTEVCVFDLLGRAGTDDFKALSKAIR
ncbi:MAG: isochorismatase family protein [Deltaproteobacteria bacterium]|nr:isochorismatase family protein [Deltaproteobacteria bacterium]MDQ3300750.1 isochorismatase family protein [Myxococcota bacterium]